MSTLLEMQNVSAFYGPSQALFDVSLNVQEGEVLALLGRNGMGKTTTVKVITRMLAHHAGQVEFDGQDIANLPSYRAARLGIGLVPEGRRCFANLTVYENLIAAARRGAWDFAAVCQLFPRLAERRDQLSVSMSGGEQQMLAIGRALMTNPRLLILDEATEGLAPVIRQEIWAAIAKLKADTGMSIIAIDKSLRELGQVADQALILEKGCTVWSGAFSELGAAEKDRYLGV